MAEQGVGAGACQKVKEETLYSEDARFGSNFDLAAARVTCTARILAAEAGFGLSVALERAGSVASAANRLLSAAHSTSPQPSVKTTKFPGKAD